MFSNNKQRSAIYSQQITILGLISIFRANIYYFETDFCEDFCSLSISFPEHARSQVRDGPFDFSWGGGAKGVLKTKTSKDKTPKTLRPLRPTKLEN